MTKVVSDGTKTMVIPLMIPGTLSGSRIFVNVCTLFAPRSLAAIIGEITEEQPGKVVMMTEIGTQALLPQPGGELLPRIC